MEKNIMRKRAGHLMCMCCLTLLFVFMNGEVYGASENVVFEDDDLKAALVNSKLDHNSDGIISHLDVIDINEDGEISKNEAMTYTGTLNLSEMNICNITGLEEFIEVTSLNLSDNTIKDIAPLLGLNKLSTLSVDSDTLFNADVSRIAFKGSLLGYDVYTYEDYYEIGDFTLKMLWYDESNEYIETLTLYSGEDSAVVIPGEFEVIGGYAFLSRSSVVVNISIPETVMTIDDFAFFNCVNLEEVDIPNSVTSIGSNAFLGCSSLKEITIPRSVKLIESFTFFGCENLEYVNILEGVTKIGSQAFKECKSLTNIKIPNSVNEIGDKVFLECSKLSKVYIIENKNLSFGNNVFESCPSNLTIYYDAVDTSIFTTPAWEEAYCYPCTISGKFAIKDNGLVGYTGNNINVSVPGKVDNKDVLSIEAVAFSGNKNIKTVMIPDSVTTIGSNALANCTSLKEITIPNSVTTIGNAICFGCTALEKASIPNSVTSLGMQTFSGCTHLSQVSLLANVENLLDWTFHECDALTEVTVPEGVKNIYPGAFYGCDQLTDVRLPDTLETITTWAFESCTSLQEVIIPANVNYIGENAFSNNIELKNIYFKGSPPTLGNNPNNSNLENDDTNPFANCHSNFKINVLAANESSFNNTNNVFDNYIKHIYEPMKLLCDNNNDGIVDIVDIINVQLVFGSTKAGAGASWDDDLDTNVDDKIDIMDLNNIKMYYGQ